MKITITTLTDMLIMLDVSPDMELVNFKALCECELGLPSQEMVITHEGRPLLDDKRDLKSHGINEGDVILIQQMFLEPQDQALDLGIDFGSIRLPGAQSTANQAQTSLLSSPGQDHASPMEDNSPDSYEDDAERFMQMLTENPDQYSRLRVNNPVLADAFQKGIDEFRRVLKAQKERRSEHERKRIQMMNSSPFDLEAQKLIAESIRQDNVDSNMEAAIEYHPESFGQVHMLYINCIVNGHPVKAFIDSGAQTTIMSQQCAERCGIMRLVDQRWAGLAKGVGIQKIIGRVHLGQIQINDVFLTSSFAILQDQAMDMLLGLDMLKRHQCCIDLKRNVLVIGTTGAETPFLDEGELPKNFGKEQLTKEELEQLTKLMKN